MGKRKERRLAAKTASNRRVKLDLLEEPSGDFGDSSNKQEVGDGENSKHDAESADSPTSSGQRAENPLLLLGQYSDEEVEEESGKEMNHDSGENSSIELDEQVKVESQNGTKTDEDENIITEKADKEKNDQSSSDILQKFEENNVIEENKTESPQLHVDAADHPPVPYTSDTGDTDSGWKMVLHEESNSYYYWNILTGQTSWEVPPALTTESAPEGVETQPNNGIANDIVFEDTDNDGFRAELEVNNNTVTLENDNVINCGNLLRNGVAQVDNSGIQDMSGHLYQGTVGDLCSDSSRLLEIGESLLERLKSLKGSEGFSEQISKLTFELDIRLADIKSLVPYGSSLLPFWLHSENQLKKLEISINDEILKYSQFKKIGEIHETINKLTANEINPEFGASIHVHENAIQPPNGAHHSVEDEDMDVEMEVEDAKISIVDESGQHNGPQLDQSIHNVPQLDQSIHESRLPEEEYNVPQPPNDEWVPPPPPPPDDEPLPPPPPDEPPETAVPPPPAEIQSAQPYFGEQYSYTYPGSTYEYYGQSQTNTELPSNSYYVDANGCQVAAPLPTLYYANPYPDGDPVMNTAQPVSYYIQNGPVSTAPVIASVETESSTHKVPTESVTKVQPKVSRNKKRTVASVPTLRSNKKVSGLVDKWKAVKEELHDDEEDEPENALEVLEKKRQREIEQWHAQQIATGEAKENANFQPLGGDWRERVRRKRAKKSTETKENVSKSNDDPNQQPDLAELSKQLPPGWQAYWDEASKQVYYGNSKTSETTWVKPTK